MPELHTIISLFWSSMEPKIWQQIDVIVNIVLDQVGELVKIKKNNNKKKQAE